MPGNHEYASGSNGVGYFENIFGSRAGNPSKGWYSFHVGDWHLIALNSNCSHVGGCGPSSPQMTFLKNDLAAHHPACTLAYWHHARFSSGPNGNLSDYDAIWKVLYSHHVDVVLSSHDHIYERYALQTPAQARDPKNGIREFVVGAGGRSLDPFTGPFTKRAVPRAHAVRRPQADAPPTPVRVAFREHGQARARQRRDRLPLAS